MAFVPKEVQVSGGLGHCDVEAETRRYKRPGARYAELQDVTTGDRLHSPTLRSRQWEVGGT